MDLSTKTPLRCAKIPLLHEIRYQRMGKAPNDGCGLATGESIIWIEVFTDDGG